MAAGADVSSKRDNSAGLRRLSPVMASTKPRPKPLPPCVRNTQLGLLLLDLLSHCPNPSTSRKKKFLRLLSPSKQVPPQGPLASEGNTSKLQSSRQHRRAPREPSPS